MDRARKAQSRAAEDVYACPLVRDARPATIRNLTRQTRTRKFAASAI